MIVDHLASPAVAGFSVSKIKGQGQVQIINHTFSHHDLRPMSVQAVRAELERNEDWVQQAFGITTRPYYRPPFGRHNRTVEIAGGLGYTCTVMWNGSFPDSEVVTTQFLLAQAAEYLQPGVINLGHANHPTVLSCFDQLVALIHSRNLTPVTLDEMFGTSRPQVMRLRGFEARAHPVDRGGRDAFRAVMRSTARPVRCPCRMVGVAGVGGWPLPGWPCLPWT